MSPPLQAPDYKHITEDCLREWKAQPAGAFRLPDPVPMARFLYELCWAIVRGDLPPQKSRVALESVVFVDETRREEELGSVLADIIAHLGQDITISGEYRSRLVKMTKSFVESSIVAPRLLQERCEEDFLWEAEQSKSKGQDLKSKEVRVNTRLLYQQTKFNLLREESEGYAKLVTLLCQVGSDPSCQNASSVTISIIKSLIGHFDLDPNRVFDIVLECFELYPDSNIFDQLIPLFPKSHAAQILGFKFQYYQRLDVNSPVPSGLFRTAALLVKSGFIDLDNVYSHLLPNDDEAFEHFDSFIARRIDEANKIGKINLAATGKDLMDDEKQEITIDFYTALEMENDIVAERAPEMEKNQKLGLLLGFLCVHDWYHAQLLFERLSHLNPVEHIEICDALFRMIEKTMSSAYDIVCQMYYYPPRKNGADKIGTSILSLSSFSLPKEFFQMLTACGPYLHRNTQLLQKVCRVLKTYYLLSKESTRAPNVVSPEFRIEEALGSCLFPSLQLIPANPAVDMEIWAVHSLLPYEARYRLYGEWEKETEQNPIVLAAKQTAKLDTRRLLKRLAKENLKPLGRMVAKLAHANPMTVLRTIVQQVEAYRDMIMPVVDAFKYLTQLEYDILQYIVIERLAQGGREKLKDDGLNLSDWLQCLASFWGHLCKKHSAVEMKSLLQYLVNQLKKGVGIELVVLEELIQQMANVQYTENMTEEQVDATAGSETLRQQSSLFGAAKNYKVLSKSTNRLKDSLLPKEEPKLAVPMLLLIAQHRSKIIIDADANATYIKMVSEQFDRCHGILLQYVEFLSSAVTPTTYAQLIPPLQDLVHKYHIEPEVAFLIYRPVMRLFKSTYGGDIYWPLEDNEEGESVSSDDLILHLDSSQESILWSGLLNTVRSILPAKAWNSLSPDLYATFWGLTLYDLHFPKDRYDTEIKKLHENLKQLEDNSDNSSIAISRRKKDKERIQDLLDKLNSESHKHQQHVASVVQRLSREKDKWLSASPDALKINMEFLQRCIYPRCVFSMQDAVYCATFVQTLHSLGTPFFNTVNHIDCLICKTLQPMICCCTEFEAGRLGRFLHDTLKMAYYWKSDESVYERECGNKPGFALYFRDPNSQRVSYTQFIRVHWKWSSRITKALNQCMESKEYMEIRNALIVLSKVSSVFPVIRKSGINLEKRVAKLKGDGREDLKVLATGVAATLAARKSSWLSEEEFGMGHLDLKPTTGRSASGNQSADPSMAKDHNVRAKSTESRHEKSDGAPKPDIQQKKSIVSANGSDSQILSSSAQGKSSGSLRMVDEPPKPVPDEGIKVSAKPASESETRGPQKRAAHSIGKVLKNDVAKEDAKSGKSTGRTANQQASAVPADREALSQAADVVQDINSTSGNGNLHSAQRKVPASSQRSTTLVTHNGAANPSGESTDLIDSTVRQQKRFGPAEEQDRLSKRRKGENEPRDSDLSEHHIDKEKALDSRSIDRFRSVDHEKIASEEQNLSRAEKLKEKFDDKYDRDPREKLDRAERRRGEDVIERSTDRLSERRERSIERMQERVTDKAPEKGREDRNKDERNKTKYAEPSVDRTHSSDERFRGQSLPPPPPLPTSFVPQSVGGNRREEDTDRRGGSTRHIQKSSPRRDEKEKRLSEENGSSFQDDGKHRREEDLRDRKREDRDAVSNKVDDRDREKGTTMKEDSDPSSTSKRRKIKRDQSSLEAGEYAPSVPQPSAHATSTSQLFDVRDRERKGVISHRTSHADDLPRTHSKDTTSKPSRREADQMHEREWEEEKRPRTETKRKHRK